MRMPQAKVRPCTSASSERKRERVFVQFKTAGEPMASFTRATLPNEILVPPMTEKRLVLSARKATQLHDAEFAVLQITRAYAVFSSARRLRAGERSMMSAMTIPATETIPHSPWNHLCTAEYQSNVVGRKMNPRIGNSRFEKIPWNQ